ncbi:glyoxalase superfamily protein [Kordiimonas marina]|uniref:glyoxalase superfamily protein n=1 Tax=Kordiimonas marina TaxID=2872312 RepID=UPI001FF34ADB|nr:glyoxalase superfamily protein [Kordiimonas marina]MCJ9430503.1 hypothetical protein [Kordiimonas marina]
MTNPSDMAKARAKRLRAYLTGAGLPVSHSQSLEAIAHEDGFRDWNTLSAHLRQAASPEEKPAKSDISENGCPFTLGSRAAGFYYNTPFTGQVRGIEMTARDGVWRITLQFNKRLKVTMGDHLDMARQRVRLTVDRLGRSVNLAGKADGHAQIAPA